MRKAKVLRQRLVEDAERMREVNAAGDGDDITAPDTPGRTGKITEAIDRDDSRLFERRDMERRREVREMMLDGMETGAQRLAREGRGEEIGNPLPLAADAPSDSGA